jgi:RimJ/RimL family protein N-acetyltransferase
VEIHLRNVTDDDLPILYEHQLDPEATRMAAFPSRYRDAFMDHWHRILADETVTARTIELDGAVAGNIVSFERLGAREVGYWIGREHWGKGIATGALQRFLEIDASRPLYARVAASNGPSIRVLEKCGFRITDEDAGPDPLGDGIEEIVLVLGA